MAGNSNHDLEFLLLNLKARRSRYQSDPAYWGKPIHKDIVKGRIKELGHIIGKIEGVLLKREIDERKDIRK